MVKLLSLLTLIVFLILFPPATLALVSQNALPGDSLYPVKRVLEEGILIATSFNPTTRAWFSAARSQRRYKEVRELVSKGEKKAAAKSLKELIEQTSLTIDQVQLLEDSDQKKQLAASLIKSIDEYKIGLTEVKQEVIRSQSVTQPAIPSSPSPSVHITPPPVSQPTPTPTPAPFVPPSQQEDGDLTEGLDEANDQLEEQRKRLEEALRLAIFATGASGESSGEEDEDDGGPIDPGDEQIDSHGWQGVFNRLFVGEEGNSQGEEKNDKDGKSKGKDNREDD